MNTETKKGIKINFVGIFYNCKNCKENILLELEPDYFEIDTKEETYIQFKNIEENDLNIFID